MRRPPHHCTTLGHATRLLLVAMPSLCLANGAVGSAETGRTAVVIHLPEQLDAPRARIFERALGKALAARGRARLSRPGESFALLARNPAVAAERRRAAELLGEALVAAQQVRLDQAVRLLGDAEAAARRGLARLVQPKLLADVLYQRGVALLPMRPGAGRGALVRSFTIWPSRPIDAPGRSPKVVAALRRAATEATRSRPPWPSADECHRAAEVLGAGQLLLATPGADGRDESVRLLRFQRAGRRFDRPLAVRWPATSDARAIAVALRGPLTALIGPADGPTAKRRPQATDRRRRLLAWIATGAAVGLAGASAALFVASSDRLADAEGLATTPPSVEYAPRARDLEDSARALRAGAVATLIGAGVAAVTATVLWLAGEEPFGPDRERAGTTLTGAGLTIHF